MAHNIEIRDGKASMVYSGEVPWHGLGTAIPADLTPEQVLVKAGLDWKVDKVPLFGEIDGKTIRAKNTFLVRDVDGKILDEVPESWIPAQNEEVFRFFDDFVGNGDMEMHTAGSLQGGKIVWCLAKVHESFDLFGGDQIDSFLLFTHSHKFGKATSVQFTPIRVVCNNTLTMALDDTEAFGVRLSHRVAFDGDRVKNILGVSKEKLENYKEAAAFLGSNSIHNKEDIVKYFTRIFPVTSAKEDTKKEISLPAKKCLEVFETQPGANYAEGSWWQAFNAVTYYVDHIAARNADNRLNSAWLGDGAKRKISALKLAVELAEVE